MKFLTLKVFYVNLVVRIETAIIRGIDSFLNFQIRIAVALLRQPFRKYSIFFHQDDLPSVGDLYFN